MSKGFDLQRIFAMNPVIVAGNSVGVTIIPDAPLVV
jgi:hypothetical protein